MTERPDGTGETWAENMMEAVHHGT